MRKLDYNPRAINSKLDEIVALNFDLIGVLFLKIIIYFHAMNCKTGTFQLHSSLLSRMQEYKQSRDLYKANAVF